MNRRTLRTEIFCAYPFPKLRGPHSCRARKELSKSFEYLDERQITHLICARLKYDLYDFFRGCFGPASFLFLV